MLYNPDEQKNIEHYHRVEKDKLDMRHRKKAGGPPWSQVFIALGAVALLILFVIIFG